jgi:aquaporin related protein
MNPARSLGPAIMSQHFPMYFWIYILGPITGAVIASGLFAVLKMLRYRDTKLAKTWQDVEHSHDHVAVVIEKPPVAVVEG